MNRSKSRLYLVLIFSYAQYISRLIFSYAFLGYVMFEIKLGKT